jgi:hypothetical protein
MLYSLSVTRYADDITVDDWGYSRLYMLAGLAVNIQQPVFEASDGTRSVLWLLDAGIGDLLEDTWSCCGLLFWSHGL